MGAMITWGEGWADGQTDSIVQAGRLVGGQADGQTDRIMQTGRLVGGWLDRQTESRPGESRQITCRHIGR